MSLGPKDDVVVVVVVVVVDVAVVVDDVPRSPPQVAAQRYLTSASSQHNPRPFHWAQISQSKMSLGPKDVVVVVAAVVVVVVVVVVIVVVVVAVNVAVVVVAVVVVAVVVVAVVVDDAPLSPPQWYCLIIFQSISVGMFDSRTEQEVPSFGCKVLH